MENSTKSPIVVSIAGLPKRKQKKVVKRITKEVTQDKGFKKSIKKSNKEMGQSKRPMGIKEIAVDCVNGERYFIDGVSINSDLRNSLSELSEHQNIRLMIHPNSNVIVEFSTENRTILTFDETIRKLGGEATGFLFLGLFMYFCSLVGLYYVAFYIIKKRKS